MRCIRWRKKLSLIRGPPTPIFEVKKLPAPHIFFFLMNWSDRVGGGSLKLKMKPWKNTKI